MQEATLEEDTYKILNSEDLTKTKEALWKLIESKASCGGISDDFKDLYTKMISFDPNKRPTIDEILASPWMKEIRDLKEEELIQLEKEIMEDFSKREIEVNKALKQKMEVNKQDKIQSSGNKSAGDEDDYFDLSLKPKFAQTGLNMENYIKIHFESVLTYFH